MRLRALLPFLLALLVLAQPAGAAKKPALGFVSQWDNSRELKLSSQIGASLNHVNVSWAQIEPTPPCVDLLGEVVHTYDWRSIDQKLSALAGSRPVVMIYSAPAWAQDPKWKPALCGLPAPRVASKPACACAYPPAPSHLSDWSAFSEAITQRHGRSMAALEIWNEPNYSRFWGPAPDPGAYAELLKASKTAAARVNPSLPVIVGGLLPSQKNVPGEQIKHQSFLKRLYKDGAAKWFDGVGAHPYPFGAPWIKGMQVRLDQLRRVQKRFRDRAPIWITEVGLPAKNGSRRWVSLDEQGPTLWKMYKSTWGQNVRSFTIYSLYAIESDEWFTSYGVTSKNYRPRPAWCHLYKKMTSRTYRARSCKKYAARMARRAKADRAHRRAARAQESSTTRSGR